MSALKYEREVQPGAEDSLSRIAGWLAPGLHVLDVGFGAGALGRYCKRLGAICDGIEADPESLAAARDFYRDVFEIDLMQASASSRLGERRYDAIVVADVLEHLIDPKAVLTDLRRLLRDGGRIILSIPNIAHVGIICDLMRGGFDYRETGLLDATHLRFFTGASLRGLLQSCGLVATEVQRVTLPIYATEFDTGSKPYPPPEIIAGIALAPEALTYQFVLTAERAGTSPARADAFDDPGPPDVVLRVHGGTAQGVIDLGYLPHRFGRDPKRVEVPIADQGPLSALGVVPADRPGAMELGEIAVLDAEGREIFSMTPGPEDLAAHGRELVWLEDRGARGALVLVTGWKPAIRLPLDAEQLKRIGAGARVAISLSASPERAMLRQFAAGGMDSQRRLLRLQCASLVRQLTLLEASAGWQEQEMAKVIESRDHLAVELELMRTSRDRMASDLSEMQDSRDRIASDLSEMRDSRDHHAEQLALMTGDRDHLIGELQSMTADRDKAARDFAEIIADRDRIATDGRALAEEVRLQSEQRRAMNEELARLIVELDLRGPDPGEWSGDLGRIRTRIAVLTERIRYLETWRGFGRYQIGKAARSIRSVV